MFQPCIREAVLERTIQNAPEQAAANGRSEATSEATERCEQGNDDGVYFGQRQVQEMDKSVVERSTCHEAVEEYEKHVQYHRACWRRDECNGGHRDWPQGHSNNAVREEAPFAFDVKYASEDAASRKPSVGWDEYRSSSCRRPITDGKSKHGCVEKDRPSRHHGA